MMRLDWPAASRPLRSLSPDCVSRRIRSETVGDEVRGVQTGWFHNIDRLGCVRQDSALAASCAIGRSTGSAVREAKVSRLVRRGLPRGGTTATGRFRIAALIAVLLQQVAGMSAAICEEYRSLEHPG